MSEANHIPPEAEEVPADSTRPGPDPSVSGPVTANHPYRPGKFSGGCMALLGVRGNPCDATEAEHPAPTTTVDADAVDLVTPATDPAPAVPSYLAMFEEYLAGQEWIGPAETPLVFHLKRLCAQLDRDPLAPAAVSSAYLQAFSRLDRRRPGAAPDPGGDPAQTTIFDHMED